ncbi:MAG TPA: DUF721 domain-containing protein [Candidatus Krumholzibacteria bacterium]|nr:DUF721 domain-containing protein [Candidatus Krumholzibacteria bacterium]
MNEGPRRLDEVLDGLIGRSPLRPGLERQQALESWKDVVGPEIARHSRAEAIHDGVLRVRVESSVWAQELVLLRSQILKGFAERLGPGEVREIRFHSGSEIL